MKTLFCCWISYNTLSYIKRLSWTPWWCHQMETFSALLAIYAGNSVVTGEFPAQRPVTRSIDVFFDLRLNKRLSKQSWGWWFKMPSRPLWRHCNAFYCKRDHFAVTMWKCWNRTKTDTLFIEQTGRCRGFDHMTYTRLIRTMSRSCIDLISRIGYLYQSINLIVPVLYLYMSLSWSSLCLQVSKHLMVLGHQQVQQWL